MRSGAVGSGGAGRAGPWEEGEHQREEIHLTEPEDEKFLGGCGLAQRWGVGAVGLEGREDQRFSFGRARRIRNHFITK